MKFDPRLDNVLSERDEKRHAELRTQLHAGVSPIRTDAHDDWPTDSLQYGGREIPMMESNVDARVVDLIDLIKREYTGKVVDLARVSQYFTLDVLTELAFGHPFGFLAQNGDIYDYIKTCAAFFPLMELRCNIPLISAIVTSRPAERVLALITSDDVGLGAVISLARKVVAERYGPDAPAKQDMLGSFISHGVSQRQAECESVLLLLAGSDSTATALRCTFLWILTNPTVYSKLVSEIDAAAAKNVLSSPVIADAEAKALPYLQACIREGLRVFPPLQGIADKLTPPGGETVGGVFIPGGTRVAFNSYQLMRRPDIWGPDAHLFRPERWLEAAPDARLRYDRTWELSFGHGRSTCLGRNIALMELGKVFVEVCTSAYAATEGQRGNGPRLSSSIMVANVDNVIVAPTLRLGNRESVAPDQDAL